MSTSEFTVKVKWGKEKLSVAVDTTQNALTLKTQLWKMTGVPVDRQKIMCKPTKGMWKGVLKDDQDLSVSACPGWAKLKMLNMIGSSDGIPEKPKADEIMFVEDMSKAEAATVGGDVLPSGLKNLGNTCYMNSVLQCLRGIPELKSALETYRSGGSGGSSGGIDRAYTLALAHLFKQMDGTTDAVVPGQFVTVMKQIFPEFAMLSQRGAPMQQDAEEMLNRTVTTLGRQLKDIDSKDLMRRLMGLQMEATYTCDECEAEPAVVKAETVFKLQVNITGGAVSKDLKVDHMFQGLRLGLDGQIEKNSAILDRNALWKKSQRIDLLPKYLCIQWMRFYWKKREVLPNSGDAPGVNCKQVRRVKFADHFDIFEFCSDRLKKILKVERDAYAEKALAKKEAKDTTSTSGSDGKKESTSTSSSVLDAAATNADGDAEIDAELQAALAMSLGNDTEMTDADTSGNGKATEGGLAAAGHDLPEGFRGTYELFAVVSHQGRTANSGHYVGWVRRQEGGDDWINFDDDDVQECKTSHVLELCGGGDREMAYMSFYRARKDREA